MPSAKPVIWEGIKYPSIAAAARAVGENYETMWQRINTGKTSEDDLWTTGNLKPTVWNGVQYRSVSAAARANYMTRQAMAYRLAQGYTCDADMEGNKDS